MRDSLPSWSKYNSYMTKKNWDPSKNVTLDEMDRKSVTRTSELDSQYEQTINIEWIKDQFK